jgi:hypothetical protein
MYTGARIIKDGLVLHFDPANVKCFRGEPTVNLLPNPTTFSGWAIDSSGASNLGTRTQQADDSFLIENNNSNYRPYTTISLSINTTYTISVKFKKKIGTPTFRWQINGLGTTITSYWTNGVQNCVQDKNGWQTLSYTFMFTDPTITQVNIFFQSGADYINYTHSYYIKEPQLEQKDYATPFVNGTRGTTVATGGGLIDLSNNGNHGEIVNNILYDSNNCGSLKFDATSAYIKIDNLSSITNGTICFWSKMDDISNWLFMVGQTTSYYVLATSGTGNFYHSNIGSNTRLNYVDGLVNNTPSTDLDWHHITLTGINLSTWTIFMIGIYSGTGFKYNGKMSNIMFYDRVLSQLEIQQNFNVTKTRYI